MVKKDLEIMRHSLAHILAAAVLEMFPEAKLGIGPVIENGFYYDFDLPRTLIPEDLPLIEEKMRVLIKQNLSFVGQEVPIQDALKEAKRKKEVYKEEILKDLLKGGEKIVSLYKTGNFVDLCLGPHVKSTKDLGAFKLTKISGAYWKGDEKRPMLQRIYGIAFTTQKELDEHIKNQQEAETRDHRKLGKELELFDFDEEVGAGLPLWYPKGALLCQIIEDFWTKEHLNNGYQIIKTPHIGNIKLWQTSGHLGFFKEDMYAPIKVDKEKYILKPMNCPFAIKIYKSRLRSYKEFPIRWAELGTVYRYERTGVLHGLLRVRGFTQDDAHIFCREDQLEDELNRVIVFTQKMLKSFGFEDYAVYLSLRDPKKGKYVGDEKVWDKAEKMLEKVLQEQHLDYQKDIGEAKFYGPAIDIKIKDSLGREWQCSTLQLDFNEPKRFNMKYIDQNGQRKQPIMLHRALLGSIERFVATLIEHYAGAFPLWLAPTQAIIIPVSEKFFNYACLVFKKLNEKGFRVDVDMSSESVGKKIREAELQKVPYMLVVGQKEEKSKSVAVRSYKKGDLGLKNMDKFIKDLGKEIKDKE